MNSDKMNPITNAADEKKVPLNLSLPASVKDGLKIYAILHKTTISTLVEDYYKSLINEGSM